MKRVVVYVSLVVLSLAGLAVFRGPVEIGILTGIATALLIPIIDLSLSYPNYRLLMDSIRLRNDDVRISASYLIKIERTGKCLLVRGERYPDQFQPIGGVYKFNPSGMELFRSWQLRSDDLLPIDMASTNDLRVRVKGLHLLPFLKWFDSNGNRELGPFREFFEELVMGGKMDTGILEQLRFDFVRRHVNKIRYSNYAQSHELLVADIFELVCSDQMIDQIYSATEADKYKFAWVDNEQIMRLGAIAGQASDMRIAITATWLV